MTGQSSPERQRIDKWLWHARVVRTRTLAQKLVEGGNVRVNREKVKAVSTPVKTGDVVTIALRAGVRVLRIQGFSKRRGSSTVAAALFEDLSTTMARDIASPRYAANPVSSQGTIPKTGEANGDSPVHPGGAGVGRPGKHDRRKLMQLKKNPNS